MLNEQLYTFTPIDESAMDALKYQIRINDKHPIYDGHFPENPITPGVCQMEMVKEILQAYLGNDVTFVTYADVKFVAMWVPDSSANVFVDLAVKETEEGYKVNAKIYSDDSIFLKLRGVANAC